MQSIVIEGPCKTSGVITPGGNKNAALPMIAAVLLTDEPVVLHNMPDILDVRVMIALAESLGVTAERSADTVTFCAKKLTKSVPSAKQCAALRASILLGGPLAVRTGESRIGLPGGDFIGRRRLDSHYYGLNKLGITSELHDSFVDFRMTRAQPSGADIFLDEASVTATEHIVLAAVLAKGRVILRNAASEPHIQQLCELLNAMGAKISGLDTNTLVIEGVDRLHGAEYRVGADHMEVAGFLAMAAATGGGIELEGDILPRHYWMTRRVMERFNIHFRLTKGHIVMQPGQRMRVRQDAGNAIPMVSDGPWPQFPSDMMSCMIVAATQAKGTVLFFEKMFESRLWFVDRLIAMGANAILCDPHRVVISGPAKLRAAELSSPDIRAGMALIIAAVCARGTSTVHNADTIFRGYENLLPKLNALGVKASLRVP